MIVLAQWTAKIGKMLWGGGHGQIEPTAEFRKAQRNMLWVGVAAWAFSLAEPTPGSKGVRVPFFDLAVPPAHLTIGLVATAIYFWWAFEHERGRTVRMNSPAASQLDRLGPEEVQARMAGLEQTVTNSLQEWREALDAMAAKLRQMPQYFEALEEVGGAMGDRRQNLTQRVNQLHTRWSRHGNDPRSFDPNDAQAMTEDLRAASETLREWLDHTYERAANRVIDIPQLQELADMRHSLEVQPQQLESLRSALEKQIREHTSLSRDMSGKEKRKFLIHDVFVPRSLVGSGLLVCVWAHLFR